MRLHEMSRRAADLARAERLKALAQLRAIFFDIGGDDLEILMDGFADEASGRDPSAAYLEARKRLDATVVWEQVSIMTACESARDKVQKSELVARLAAGEDWRSIELEAT